MNLDPRRPTTERVKAYRTMLFDRWVTAKREAEGPWTARNKPPFGFYTDTDQQARFPGDRGLELVASLPSKAVNWPTQ